MAKLQFKLLDDKQLATAINSVKTSGARFDALVQSAAANCIAQSVLHNNATPANDLFHAMPKGSRRDSLAAYFEKFGNLGYLKADKKIVYYNAKLEKADWTPAYSLEVMAFPWTSGTKAADPKSTWDIEEEAQKFIDRMVKIAANSVNTVAHRDLIADLKNAYTSYVVRTSGTPAPANDTPTAATAEQLAALVAKAA